MSTTSAGEEAQAHLPVSVVDIRVHQHDALPGTECGTTAKHWHRERRRHEGRQQVITAVTGAAVPVPIDVVAGKQPVNGILEVGLRAAPSLDQCDAGSCVRNEDLTQSVAAVATELKDPVSEISDETATGTHLHNIAIHRSIIPTAGVIANATFRRAPS
jgi:hypothetical protein